MSCLMEMMMKGYMAGKGLLEISSVWRGELMGIVPWQMASPLKRGWRACILRSQTGMEAITLLRLVDIIIV